ncbi:MAG: DUF1211 domain-containing protein [Phycisphaerales bacterium]|nr:DUF1211 domain-containing protein [Phycisphaerales bacterium]
MPNADAAAPAHPHPHHHAPKETGRLEAFSDGVFAIALTLLVFDLKIPHQLPAAIGTDAVDPGHALWKLLTANWPSYVAFLTSFFSLLVMWSHHHTVIAQAHRCSRALIVSNGLLLLGVSIVPFPTAVVADYVATPAGSVAAAFHCGCFTFIAVTFQLLARAAFHENSVAPTAHHATIEQIRGSYRFGPFFYLAAFATAFISPWGALAICTLLWVLWASTMTGAPRREK